MKALEDNRNVKQSNEGALLHCDKPHLAFPFNTVKHLIINVRTVGLQTDIVEIKVQPL